MTVDCSDMGVDGDENALYWSIRLPDRQVDDRFSNLITKEILNNRGFYESSAATLGPGMSIQMINNETDSINGTKLECVNSVSGKIIQSTSIFIYG